MKRLAVLLVAILLASILSAYAAIEGDDAKILFEEKCSLCHILDYSTNTRDTMEGWTATVTRMKEENGADLTAEETEAIIKYLSTHYGR